MLSHHGVPDFRALCSSLTPVGWFISWQMGDYAEALAELTIARQIFSKECGEGHLLVQHAQQYIDQVSGTLVSIVAPLAFGRECAKGYGLGFHLAENVCNTFILGIG